MRVIMEPEIEDYSLPTYKALVNGLREQKYEIVFRRVRKRIKKKRARFYKYPVLRPEELKRTDLLIVWSPYATSHHARKWCAKYRVRLLHMEDGFLHKSVLCDISGFWGRVVFLLFGEYQSMFNAGFRRKKGIFPRLRLQLSCRCNFRGGYFSFDGE